MIKRLLGVAAAGLFSALAIATPSTAASATTPASATATAVSSAHVETEQPSAAETPLSFWRLEATYPYRNATEDQWALLSCRSDAGFAMRQGALDFYCTRNVQHSRWELWIEWPDNCPSCRTTVTIRS